MRRVLEAAPLTGFPPGIGHWLWALEEVRRGTLSAVRGLDQRTLHWEGPEGGENAIGSLLYHIGLVEMSWLYMDVLEAELPPDVLADYPLEMSEGGRLARVPSVPLAAHLERLARGRERFLREAPTLCAEDWRRLRSPEDVDYSVTPEWAVFHLVEHEAGHGFQIRAMRRRARKWFEGDG